MHRLALIFTIVLRMDVFVDRHCQRPCRALTNKIVGPEYRGTIQISSATTTIHLVGVELVGKCLVKLHSCMIVHGQLLAAQPLSHKQAIEHRFIDVGTFSCGSVFGLGEVMPHRMVVARNRVQCLVIPRDWLFEKQQNVGNTWQRIRMMLDITIQRDRLFELFMRDQHWQHYRKTLVSEFVRRNPRRNLTQLADVPIMCRIERGSV
uniref:Cyclic nucleotide-binding domain-containing protein n=1 Tax=Anopheles culicifacies TaxID=139723 RepID=A0A182M9K2_9DIPT